MRMARPLFAEKPKFLYDPLHASIRRSAIGSTPSSWTGRGRLPGDWPHDEEIRANEFLRKLECNALKGHDSRVNKGVKSSAERVSNACRTHAERALNDAGWGPNAPRSADPQGNPNGSRRRHPGERLVWPPGWIRRQSPSTDGRFDADIVAMRELV